MSKVHDFQNWKVSKEIYARLDIMKNIDMIMFRMSYNLSQAKAARMANIHHIVWMNIENKKVIPTINEAGKIAFLLGKPVFKLFPQTRHDTIRSLPLRSFSKLALIRCIYGISQIKLAKRAEVPFEIIQRLEREWKVFSDIPEEKRILVQKVADYLNEDIINIIGEGIIKEGN